MCGNTPEETSAGTAASSTSTSTGRTGTTDSINDGELGEFEFCFGSSKADKAGEQLPLLQQLLLLSFAHSVVATLTCCTSRLHELLDGVVVLGSHSVMRW